MADRKPLVVVLAGANGSGKTTAAPFILRDRLHVTEFVNADTIARGLSEFNVESVGFDAGRIRLRRLNDLAEQRASFAFETSLSSRTFAPFLIWSDSVNPREFDALVFRASSLGCELTWPVLLLGRQGR